MTRRRDLTALLASLPFAFPFVADAQQDDRLRRIGVLKGDTYDIAQEQAEYRAFTQQLGTLGWVEGRNVALDYRSFAGTQNAAHAAARELIRLAPDAILSRGSLALIALRDATRTIPIVFTYVSDPVGDGLIKNLARPGGNLTGFTLPETATAGKWLELLKEIAPRVTRTMVVMMADLPPQEAMRDAVAALGPGLGVKVSSAAIRDIGEVERWLDAFAREPGGGLVVLPNAVTMLQHERVQALAARYHLPAVYAYPFFVRSGGLASYGVDAVDQCREAARYVDKILRGAKPGALPIRQPTTFSLVLNLKTARELGLSLPPPLLSRADEVVE